MKKLRIRESNSFILSPLACVQAPTYTSASQSPGHGQSALGLRKCVLQGHWLWKQVLTSEYVLEREGEEES